MSRFRSFSPPSRAAGAAVRAGSAEAGPSAARPLSRGRLGSNTARRASERAVQRRAPLGSEPPASIDSGAAGAAGAFSPPQACRRSSPDPALLAVDGSDDTALTRPCKETALVNEANIRRIWQRLDRNNSGSVKVKDIVANAAFVQKECPRLLEEHGRIAREGVVKFQDVRRLLGGLLDRSAGAEIRPGCGQSPQPLSETELRAFFDRVKDADNAITAKVLVEHKELVCKGFPALISDFEKIDLDHDSKITWEELKVFNGGTAEWLEHQLESIVGLTELKDQIRAFYRSIVLDRNRKQHGHDVSGLAKSPHMIFQGNPGTGKTSLGRIMARLLYRIGVIGSPELREVQRPDLVAEHVGQTGPKTKAVLESSKTGVLFIDEAYRLSSVESKNDFGREAVETLMAAMNEPIGKAPVMIFAGYTRDMGHFMRTNEGLYRRISYSFDFADYSPSDLACILDHIATRQGFRIDPERLANGRQPLARLIEECTSVRARALMNGGLCERIFDMAKQNLDARDNPSDPSVVLSSDDIRAACLALPPPPPDSPARFPSFSASCAAPRPASAALHSPSASSTASPQQALRSVAIAAATKAPSLLPKPHSSITSPLGPQAATRVQGGERNLWFHIGPAQDLRKARLRCCGPIEYLISVRVDHKEVHRTTCGRRDLVDRSLCFEETRIVPYSGESLLEFVVLQRRRGLAGAANRLLQGQGQLRCVGSACLALPGLEAAFDGALDLRLADKPAGYLYVKVGWQFVAGAMGEELLRACFQPG